MADPDEVAISHLQRRKIEARVLLPLLQTLKEKLGEDVTREVLDATITRLAVADGRGPPPTDRPSPACAE